MSPFQRAEMWILLALEAAEIAQTYRAWIVDGRADRRLDMRISASRGLSRGLDFRLLPYSAWETGREFLTLLDGLLNDDNLVAVRVGHVADLVVVAGRLEVELRAFTVRPRADLDD